MSVLKIFYGPVKTFLRHYAAILSVPPPIKTLLMTVLGMAAGWWMYVPLHELLHAAGCLVTGGAVSRLDIQPIYGGNLLAGLIPFVEAGGDYAGRLSGFDTNGSDWCYFVTVYFPYILTWGGLWLTETAVVRRSGALFGFALPCLFAPLVSLTGDFLEIGSLVLYQIWPGAGNSHRRLISDDLFRLIQDVAANGSAAWDSATIAFIGFSLVVGAVLAWVTLVVADQVRSFSAAGQP